ncbi:tyrosine-type recombinase/integrase [Embleya sp. NPDC059259]|uniref:tyrosine-type recombinase/integrase n=1 Tax=unclassified Embleya TaxID=2699296 RepID=UPI0036A5A379
MADRPKRRPRGYIEQLPSGSWRAVVYAGIDPLTKEPRRLRETCPTEPEAEKAKTRLQALVDARQHPRSRITVADLMTKWMEVAEHEDSTSERYEQLNRLYIVPTLGAEQAATVDAELLERFYARLRLCKDLCSGKKRAGHTCVPLAANTVRKIHFMLSGAFGRGVRWKYLTINEVDLAQPPAFEPTTPDPPSAAEAARLLNTAWGRDLDWGTMLFVAMVAGCRRGELCGLRWRDVDFDARILSVQNSTDKHSNLKATKTRQARRIAFDEITGDLLVALRDRYEARCQQLEVEPTDDAFVFSLDPQGATPWRKASVSQKYRRLALEVSLRSTRIQALRHYSATELVSAGVDLRTVSGRLGHGSGGATTLRMYAAWVSEADKRAAGMLAPNLPGPGDGPAREPVHPWEQIAAVLEKAIRNGDYPAGQPLPPVKELAETHAVTASTAHRAIAHLATLGLVVTARGKRTTVAELPEAATENTSEVDVLACACGSAGPWGTITLGERPQATCAACGAEMDLPFPKPST